MEILLPPHNLFPESEYNTYLIPTEPLPTSIFSLSVTENQVDIVRKLQEDPLYLIQKREIESREQLLKNPRKMKQLQEMVS